VPRAYYLLQAILVLTTDLGFCDDANSLFCGAILKTIVLLKLSSRAEYEWILFGRCATLIGLLFAISAEPEHLKQSFLQTCESTPTLMPNGVGPNAAAAVLPIRRGLK
jgi:hypothetical protein